MSVFDSDLVRAINSGRCFLLVGSGASCELGAPSWRQLAEIIISEIEAAQHHDVVAKCQSLLDRKDYPGIFSLARTALGWQELLALLARSIQRRGQRGRVYEYAAKWPLPCYLTTNFDDHLQEHLESVGQSYAVRRNSKGDMSLLRADAKNLIFKIHGDLTVPDDIVLTSEQYSEFQEGESREYWREKIRSVLHMVSLVIMGYSASDPDFKEQLERAKRIVQPDRPVFMFATDVDPEAIREYYLQFNIRVIPYENQDGTHRELHRLLRRYDPFIAKRVAASLDLEEVDEAVATLASAMYLFTKLRLSDTTDSCIEQTYASVILQVLSQLSGEEGVRVSDIHGKLAERTFAASDVDPTAMQEALDSLYSAGLVTVSPDAQIITLAPSGVDKLEIIRQERLLLHERFRTGCQVFLAREHPGLTAGGVDSVIEMLRRGLVRAFERRGMEIARSVFSDEKVDVSDATDILETVNMASGGLADDDQRRAFADLMMEVMLRPDEDMKEYLAALSQGYFAYHALGLEPRCSQERLDLAKQKDWLLDSSVILPALALECPNHRYALDLLERMRGMGLRCRTTARLFDEARDHAWWAVTNFGDLPVDDLRVLHAGIGGPGYRHNLFVDGFMKWSLSQGAPSFHQYMTECLGPNYRKNCSGSVSSMIEELGIEVIGFSEWPGMSEGSRPHRDAIAQQIQQLRMNYGTYRGEAQCVAEAEVVLIAEGGEAVFLSQSGILNRVSRTDLRISWTPQAMYRFLALFSSTPVGSDLLYACMIEDFYYSGFDIVNKSVIKQFAEPMVRQARMRIDQERERYEQALGRKRFHALEEGLERVPDEQKPFYSMQFAFYVAELERGRRQRAEARVVHAEEAKRLTDVEREELMALRELKAQRRKRDERKRRKHASRPKGTRKRRKRKKTQK